MYIEVFSLRLELGPNEESSVSGIILKQPVMGYWGRHYLLSFLFFFFCFSHSYEYGEKNLLDFLKLQLVLIINMVILCLPTQIITTLY